MSLTPSPANAGPSGAVKYMALLTAIDSANSLDPNVVDGRPLALVQGQVASRWLGELEADASDELQLAVRAHHLKRWELKRTDFPEGRAGYLKWRRKNKAHQADSLASLMEEADWPESSVERARVLLGRTQLKSDSETQALEDAACLVFLETQFDDMASRTDHDHMVAIVTKTLKKMSPYAVTLAGAIGLSTTAQAVLSEAAETLPS